jgi:hypothetical protein
MLPDPYLNGGVGMDPNPTVVVGTGLANVDGRAENVCVVEPVVVVTVGRLVVMGLSRVEGRYVNRVGIR